MSDFESTDSDHSRYLSDETTSSSEEELELFQNEKKVKNKDYAEVIIPEYSDGDFFEHFRVTREVAESIAEQFSTSNYYTHHAGEFGKINAFKYTLIYLWFVGHEAASFRDVADRFCIALSTLFKIIRKMTYFLSNQSQQVIKWPTETEAEEIERYFAQHGFPGVIGVIDGTHIKIDRPSEDPDSYLNRKHFFSIHVNFAYTYICLFTK